MIETKIARINVKVTMKSGEVFEIEAKQESVVDTDIVSIDFSPGRKARLKMDVAVDTVVMTDDAKKEMTDEDRINAHIAAGGADEG